MSSQKAIQLLIVDDERSNILTLAQILKPQYDILVAKDGPSALKIAKEQGPDLILLDVVMPAMSGFEVLAKLKSQDETRRIPVIFITGRDSVEDEEAGLFLGAVDYITKPFHNSIVVARVRTQVQMAEYIRTIEHLGVMDALTDLPNRRSFDNRLGVEWARAARERKPIALLVIDLDKFKEYNDTYGHPQGDALLQVLAKILKQELKRPADFAARWGGEEFVVLLPDTDEKGAREVAERIRARMEQTSVPCADGMDTNVTVSIGLNVEKPDLNMEISQLLLGADKALYMAKNSGRNRVVTNGEAQ